MSILKVQYLNHDSKPHQDRCIVTVQKRLVLHLADFYTDTGIFNRSPATQALHFEWYNAQWPSMTCKDNCSLLPHKNTGVITSGPPSSPAVMATTDFTDGDISNKMGWGGV